MIPLTVVPTVTEPTAVPAFVVVIVVVELVPAATPVTVTKPLVLIATVLGSNAVPAHV